MLKRKYCKSGKVGANHTFYLSHQAYSRLEHASKIFNKSKSELLEIIINQFYEGLQISFPSMKQMEVESK